jgi:hypothetical protein
VNWIRIQLHKGLFYCNIIELQDLLMGAASACQLGGDGVGVLSSNAERVQWVW